LKLYNETINKSNTQSTEYNVFINLKAELAKQYINTILEFVPKCVSIFAPLDIIGTFANYRGISYVSSAGDDETILFTVVIDDSMGREMKVSIIGI
jgi:hypothetical protein